MPSIRKSLLQFVFSGAFMKRWNDKLRPMELLEIDKQAHKMVVAWALFMCNSRGLSGEERLRLGGEIAEGGLFDYFYRLVITDIKPPIFYQIKANPEHYRKLTRWVLERMEPRVQTLGPEFWERLRAYFAADENTLSRRILSAAHTFASGWEFNLIKGINPRDDEFQEIDESFNKSLAEHADLVGVDELMAGWESPLGRFGHLTGQLRFQKRWSQTPRIPETSVLGHMFTVACYAYFFSLTVGACRARCQNNFYAGLFHDLPELLTRDIISPVKRSVDYLADLVNEYERKELTRRVFEPLQAGGHGDICERLAFFLGLGTGSEFHDTALVDGRPVRTDFAGLQAGYNEDRFDPKDGELLKICDIMAAFIEAYTALRNGISSDQLQAAIWRMRSKYGRVSLGDAVHVGALLADFD
ncbi:MAG: HD domain-containing protein [Desulfovibrionaceae bacterium]|jgi:putative hydrolase of HD superfamily|nr:HD domain-containing protein [Desulfovibrionaceae bacterium]